jgi:hypothetical protein
VRPRREQLRDDGRLEALLDEAECGAKAGAAGTDDDGVVLVIDDCKKKTRARACTTTQTG